MTTDDHRWHRWAQMTQMSTDGVDGVDVDACHSFFWQKCCNLIFYWYIDFVYIIYYYSNEWFLQMRYYI